MVNVKKYGIIATYRVGGDHEVWYFTETQRNRILFDMKRRPEITKVSPIKRK